MWRKLGEIGTHSGGAQGRKGGKKGGDEKEEGTACPVSSTNAA